MSLSCPELKGTWISHGQKLDPEPNTGIGASLAQKCFHWLLICDPAVDYWPQVLRNLTVSSWSVVSRSLC
ncbi:hypothetical protein XELAEV_18036598mg [Xenopus laevis]|uniref:Uncharacterized protein n=1 Tax=Xenopus laevis TaxID=8355 RepID=A0A974CAI7_XENLA|nr:hypothetical protein XELAEV_18036598mg [Xenopus laevis]